MDIKLEPDESAGDFNFFIFYFFKLKMAKVPTNQIVCMIASNNNFVEIIITLARLSCGTEEASSRVEEN